MGKKLQVVNGDGDSTKIQWTWTERADGTFAPGYTFNPWTRCTEASPACDNCYARAWAGRAKHPRGADGSELPVWGDDAPRDPTSERNWNLPFAWQAAAAAMNETRKVFCASLADVFEDHPHLERLVPAPTRRLDPTGKVRKTLRAWLWDLIVATPNLIWMLLTKRPENILRMVPPEWVRDGFPPNVWVGTTVENQEWADKRIPHLLRVPAVVRFLSCEPLLGPLDLSRWTTRRSDGKPMCSACCNKFPQHGPCDHFYRPECPACGGSGVAPGTINLVIAGGESGHGARPNDLAWSRSLRDQAVEAGACFFMKQYGAHPVDNEKRIRLADSHGGDMKEWAEDLRVRQMPAAYQPRKVAA